MNKALAQIDAVIATIKAAKEAKAAQAALIEKFAFSERQAVAILEMRLQRLTGLEREKIERRRNHHRRSQRNRYHHRSSGRYAVRPRLYLGLFRY